MTRLIADGHPADALDAPRPREIGEIEHPGTWASTIPVDERHGHPVLEDGVERPGVSVDHALPRSRERMPSSCFVEMAKHRASGSVGCLVALAWVGCRLAGDELEDVAPFLIDPQKARRSAIADFLEIGQQHRGERRTTR